MDAHRSRSLGMAALVFILISLTAAVFHGAAPVRAEDVSTPSPIVIDENAATVDVKLYKDNSRTELLGNDAVTSVSTLYGTFSANFLTDKHLRLGTMPPSISSLTLLTSITMMAANLGMGLVLTLQ